MPKPAKPIILVLDSRWKRRTSWCQWARGASKAFSSSSSPSYKLATSGYLLMTINSES